MDFRFLVTGYRDYNKARRVWGLLHATRSLADAMGRRLVVVVGDCPTGADAWARRWCEMYQVDYELYEANWNRYGRRAGPVRNREMVDSGVDAGAAFCHPLMRGTADCLGYARTRGVVMLAVDYGLSRE